MAVIGLGVDVVDIARAEAMLVAHRKRVIERLLTADEIAYVTSMPHPPRHLAVRLAAKEAVYKALQSLPNSRAIGAVTNELVAVMMAHRSPLLLCAATSARPLSSTIGRMRSRMKSSCQCAS